MYQQEPPADTTTTEEPPADEPTIQPMSATEEDLSTETKFIKKITVVKSSSVDGSDEMYYTDISEKLAEKGTEFRLYLKVDGQKVDVTDDPNYQVTFVDTDGNGIDDQVQWMDLLL